MVALAKPAGIVSRPFDLGLIAFFVISMAYGFLISLPEGLGLPVTADSPWSPLRGLYQWAVTQEPGHLSPSLVLRFNAVFDGFVQSPLLILISYGLWQRKSWVVPLGLFYAGASVMNMCIYFTQTFLGPYPPPNLPVYIPFNLPWLIGPALLAVRLWNGRV